METERGCCLHGEEEQALGCAHLGTSRWRRHVLGVMLNSPSASELLRELPPCTDACPHRLTSSTKPESLGLSIFINSSLGDLECEAMLETRQ